MWHVICDTNQQGAFKYVEENSVIIHLFNLIYITSKKGYCFLLWDEVLRNTTAAKCMIFDLD